MHFMKRLSPRPAPPVPQHGRARRGTAVRLDLAGLAYPGGQDRGAGPGRAEEIVTVAALAERRIMPVGDQEIRALTAGCTVRTVNLVTGQSAILHYSRAGQAAPRLDVHGITRSPAEMARMIAELIGNSSLEYGYQPQVPLLTVLLYLGRYGFTKKTRAGVHVPGPFWLPIPGMVREWQQRGYKSFFRFTPRLEPAMRSLAGPARSIR
jgi:hypothetical protein